MMANVLRRAISSAGFIPERANLAEESGAHGFQGSFYFYIKQVPGDDHTINYVKGRGSQLHPHNRFRQLEYVQQHGEGLDEELHVDPRTQIYYESPKKIINRVASPDIGMDYSINPYQGCEHGCIYCYARNTHPYWGLNAGLDFESKIMVKQNAPELLAKELSRPGYVVKPVMLSGNTDCYQPLEKKLRVTRSLLEVLEKFNHPVGIITKNSLILRDLDLLGPMAEKKLVSVTITITTLNEELRRLMEPRTVSGLKRVATVRALAARGIPVNVNLAPIIPFLNSDEIPSIMKTVAEAGAVSAMYTMVRLNGDVAAIFEDWLRKNFPGRAGKVLNQIRSVHGGTLNDSRFVTRMKGEGEMAGSISKLFKLSRSKYLGSQSLPAFDTTIFKVPGQRLQLSLF
jgi:DNA repair photolyase